jgi:hypothetical protein
MIVKAKFTGFGLTEGKEYEVLFEHDTVYELVCDNGGTYCRNKDFFEIINNKQYNRK